MTPRPSRGTQQGVALISMLLVFALVVILVSGTVTRANYDIRKTSYHLLNSQAYQYALGGEALARQMLYQDWLNDQEVNQGDSHQDVWYAETQFKPDHGLMRVHIRDLESRFNLNNLVNPNGEADAAQLQQFQRLLRRLSLPTDASSPNNYVSAIVDWIDADTVPRTAHSEDVYFQSQENDFRSADALIADPSELYALGALDPDDLRRLLPYVTALPYTTPINPNTASDVVLSSLHPQLNAAQIIRAREQLPQGFTTTQDFLAHGVTAGVDLSQARLDVRSQYFQVSVAARYQEHTTYLQSLLHREPQSGSITVLSRSLQRPADVFNTRATQKNPPL